MYHWNPLVRITIVFKPLMFGVMIISMRTGIYSFMQIPNKLTFLDNFISFSEFLTDDCREELAEEKYLFTFLYVRDV